MANAERGSSQETKKSQEQVLKDFEHTFLIEIARPDHLAKEYIHRIHAIPETLEIANQRIETNEGLIQQMRDMITSRGMESSDPSTKVEIAKLLDEARFQGIHAFAQPNKPGSIRMNQQTLERYEENPVDTKTFEIVREALKNPDAKFSTSEGQRISKLLEQYKNMPEKTKEELLSYLNEQLEEARKAENEIRESAASKKLPEGKVDTAMKSYEKTYDTLTRQREEIRRLINVLEGRS